MILPLYVAIEKIDRRLIEAATDLYASRAQAFWRVTFLLSLPGVVAGSLLTFIPAVGDFINAEIIGAGNPQVIMIGNIIQRKYLDRQRLPGGGGAGVRAGRGGDGAGRRLRRGGRRPMRLTPH